MFGTHCSTRSRVAPNREPETVCKCFCVTVITRSGNLGATPPWIEGVVRPLDPRVGGQLKRLQFESAFIPRSQRIGRNRAVRRLNIREFESVPDMAILWVQV